jgi:thiamine pyrophosphokinase
VLRRSIISMITKKSYPDTVILCNGEPPRAGLLRHYVETSQRLIVADGGMLVLEEFDIQPHFLIGDFDSYQPSGSEPFEVRHDPDQETNDLEKALALALQEAAQHVAVLGATGRRLDHSLKNLSVLKQFNDAFDELYFHDNYGITRLIASGFERNYEIGTSLSLFPLSGTVSEVRTEGLKYSLNRQDLINGEQDGSSNTVVESPVRIQYKSGDLLLFEVHDSES